MYYDGCNAETTLQDLPIYIQPYGTLVLSLSSQCSTLNLKYWTMMNMTYECSGKTDFEVIDYPYLEIMNITGSYKYDYSKSLTLQSLELIWESLIDLPMLKSFIVDGSYSFGEVRSWTLKGIVTNNRFLIKTFLLLKQLILVPICLLHLCQKLQTKSLMN